MNRFRWNWLCKILGHHFKKIKDLKRGRIVYCCSRCSERLIERTKNK